MIESSDLLQSQYELEEVLNQYLLFHYGNEADQMPFAFGPKNSLNFPERCVTECLDVELLPTHSRALDIGCAVGRSSFELSRYCNEVTAIDKSQNFISTAKVIQKNGKFDYSFKQEGARSSKCIAELPQGINPQRVQFECYDAMDLFKNSHKFHVVLAANLICRLPDPLTFLKLLPSLVASSGQLILISPYSWLENFTPKENWLEEKYRDKKNCLNIVQEIFKGQFSLIRVFDMPFLIREHLRKYQWGVAQASMWQRVDFLKC